MLALHDAEAVSGTTLSAVRLAFFLPSSDFGLVAGRLADALLHVEVEAV